MKKSELIDAVRDALSSSPRNEELAKHFLSSKVGARCYVVGRNDQSRELIDKCAVVGVIDDFDQTNSHWSGKPIVRSESIPFDAIVANCSTSISPQDVERNLTRAGVRNIVAFSDLARIAPREIQQPWFVAQQRMDTEQHLNEWAELYLTLWDSRSRQTLLDVVRYRLTADPGYMQGYEVRLKEQYFESFLDPKRQVFVDAGGFDGDTTHEFCKRYPDYRKVFVFEPSPTNMASAKRRLAGFRDIEFFTAGLSDSEGTLHFNANAGPASSVCGSGGETIPVTTLDKAVSEPVSFIKMDLEGWEMSALIGSRMHIKQDKPQLAIAVYHCASDFRRIPSYVRSLNPNYRIYIRHYTQGWSETVMFFTDSSVHR